jgi:molecular chaperone GrpE
MEENKKQDQKPEKDNLKDRVEDLKNTVSGKAGEFAKEAKDKAENFAEKTLDAAEKIMNDVFKKNKPEDADFEEEHVDPKDIEIKELKRELDELRDKYVRLYADFDNARKRMAKDRIELIQTAGKDVITSLLPVVDDFERSLKAQENSDDAASIKEGEKLIHTKLTNILASKGLKAMESIGKDFDVNVHEAITEIPAPKPELEGKVVDEVEKGYYLNDKIIRFAKVIVGKKAE